VIPIKFDFTKDEVKIIKEKIYLTDLQEKIFDMKLQGNLTEIGMALELGVSESTITYQWKKVKKKILKVI
jgi:DNA-binding CsgD family transcriptional regulator